MSGSTPDPRNDPNKKESIITLTDARQSIDPLPIQRIQLDKVHDVKRYVVVIIKEVWGGDLGKIDYFDQNFFKMPTFKFLRKHVLINNL